LLRRRLLAMTGLSRELNDPTLGTRLSMLQLSARSLRDGKRSFTPTIKDDHPDDQAYNSDQQSAHIADKLADEFPIAAKDVPQAAVQDQPGDFSDGIIQQKPAEDIAAAAGNQINRNGQRREKKNVKGRSPPLRDA